MKRSFFPVIIALGACADEAAPPRDGAPDVSVDVAAEVAGDARPDGPACVASPEQPAPRGDATGVVDPATGHLYVFGGDTGPTVQCIPAPAFSAETWRYDPRCDRWDRLTPAASPSPRSRAAWALDTRRRRMIVFGGRFREGTSGAYTLYRDVWSFDLATERWAELSPKGEAPSARANAAAVYDAEADAFVLFGGNTSTSGLSFTPRNDTWALDLASVAWRRVATTGAAPTARLFHAAAVVGRAMWVFGGGGANAFMGPFYSDLWRLDLATSAWSRVALSGESAALGGRISAALVPVGAGAVLLGGHDDGALGNRNDVLTLSAEGAVAVARAGDEINRPGAGFCDFPADFTTTDDASPERRSAFVYAVDPARNRALVFGGKTDCGSAGDVWAVDLGTHAWSPLRGSIEGLSCQRAGRQNCRSLCN